MRTVWFDIVWLVVMLTAFVYFGYHLAAFIYPRCSILMGGVA